PSEGYTLKHNGAMADMPQWLVAACLKPNPPGASARPPTISVTAGELHILATEAESALIAAGAEIFQRALLVRPPLIELPAYNNRKTQAAVLAEVTRPGMIDELSRVAHWEKWNERKKRQVLTDPPDKLAAIVLSRFGRWRFPHVLGIISTPTLRSDGSLITRPGLDE